MIREVAESRFEPRSASLAHPRRPAWLPVLREGMSWDVLREVERGAVLEW